MQRARPVGARRSRACRGLAGGDCAHANRRHDFYDFMMHLSSVGVYTRNLDGAFYDAPITNDAPGM